MVDLINNEWNSIVGRGVRSRLIEKYLRGVNLVVCTHQTGFGCTNCVCTFAGASSFAGRQWQHEAT